MHGNGTQSWGVAITSFVDTKNPVGRQKLVPLTIWDATAKKMEACYVICLVFLVNYSVNTTTFDMEVLIEDTGCFGVQQQAQVLSQLSFPAALLCLLQT